MRFEEIPGKMLSVRIRSVNEAREELREQDVLSVAMSAIRDGELEVRVEGGILDAVTVVPGEARRLAFELAGGGAMLARLVNPAVDGSIELQIASFPGECLEMGEIEISVDEYVHRSVDKIERRKTPLGNQKKYECKLEDYFCFRQGTSAFFFMIAGAGIQDLITEESISVPEEKDGQEESLSVDAASSVAGKASLHEHRSVAPSINERGSSFCLVGDVARFVATESILPDGKTIFLSSRFGRRTRRTDNAVRLAKGHLRFVDWTRAGQVQVLAKAQLKALAADESSYLRKWDEFGDLEGEILLGRARDIGAVQYSDPVINRDGTVSLRITAASESALAALEAGHVQDIDVVNILPIYLLDHGFTFRDFVETLEKEMLPRSTDAADEDAAVSLVESYKVVSFDREVSTLIIEAESSPVTGGSLVLSLAGEVAQIKRRIMARRAILEGRAANPQLGLLIEEKGRICPVSVQKRTPELSAFVVEKIFAHPPTEMQKAAIDVALNTPDIAVIQGPPGTGKTTVIAAILERLNELSDKRAGHSTGRVLLTGFQHDAVENMISRLSLNGIPVPKFGRRSDAGYDDFSFFEERLEEWCLGIAATLKARHPGISEVAEESAIRSACLQYLRTPSRALAVGLVRQIKQLGQVRLGDEIMRRAEILERRLLSEEAVAEQSRQLLPAVRCIRARRESFFDDGPERAIDAFEILKEHLDEDEQQLLDQASLWRQEDGPPAFLDDLSSLKRRLLVRFTAPPVFRTEKHNDEVGALAELAIEAIRKNGRSEVDAKAAAIAEFVEELEGNIHAMVDAVSEYSFAFAATCQQSINRQMQEKKGVGKVGLGHSMEYDYVIVDEAARVSPRDLMVPMVQGRRIILVGDHRQLPHIVDEEIARQMENGADVEHESDWLKKSMFEYLFSERLKALEAADNQPRRVTLDVQYRMHPVLGDFISRNFYERFDPKEKFTSGRLEGDFIQKLPDAEGKPAAWLNVPADKGRHERVGSSWTRPAEAKAIANKLREWYSAPEGAGLTFGVISFYKAQAELIRRQLGKGNFDERRLRIGTVDSFQGMEFDVVFLSVVRTVRKAEAASDLGREQQATKLFGHLCLYNRLNVSMSRQKKLLVVVGDSGLVLHDLAREFIPGLVDFHSLCQAKGALLEC